jgi:hypothetical protein
MRSAYSQCLPDLYPEAIIPIAKIDCIRIWFEGNIDFSNLEIVGHIDRVTGVFIFTLDRSAPPFSLYFRLPVDSSDGRSFPLPHLG